MADPILNKKGQGILEMVAVFISMVLLLGGILNIWLWANKQIVERQRAYNLSRVGAGTSSDTYKLADYWPVYAPENLSEDKVILAK